MGAVLFTTPYFFQSATPPPASKTATKTSTDPHPSQPAVGTPATRRPAPARRRRRRRRDRSRPEPRRSSISTLTSTHIKFSNRGAVVQSWILKKYKDSNQKPLEVINPKATAEAGYPFSFTFKNRKPAVDLNNALYAIKRSDDGLEIDFEFSDGKVFARKSFHFTNDSYLSQIIERGDRRGDAGSAPDRLAGRIRRHDRAQPGRRAAQHSLRRRQTAS